MEEEVWRAWKELEGIEGVETNIIIVLINEIINKQIKIPEREIAFSCSMKHRQQSLES